MFKRLFSKKPRVNTVATLAVMTEKLERLEKREKDLVKKVANEVEKAKLFLNVKNKRAAIQCLRRKKTYEVEIEKLGKYQLNIHDQMILIEAANSSTDTVMALKTGASTIKALQKETKIDDVDKTMSVINDQCDNVKQIQDILSAPFGPSAEFDEDELEAELEELEGSNLEEQLLQPISTPPVQAREQVRNVESRIQPAEEDELAALQAELAL